jgi:AcrR family transcriptional regulator
VSASSAPTSQEPGRRRGYARSVRTREAILDATLDLLRDRGFAGTSIDAIAAEAGVSKTTIYGQWRSKSEIVVDLFSRFTDEAVLTPDTGDLRTDLMDTLRGLVKIAEQLRGVAPSVIAEASRDPLLADAFERFVGKWRRHERELIRRSIARGLLSPDLDEEIAADLVASTIYFRILVPGSEPIEGLPERLVNPILRAWGAKAQPPFDSGIGR